MKIALACRVYPATHRPGGMPFVCQDRARALVEAGHEVHVLTTGIPPHRGAVVDDHGVDVHCMPCKAEAYSAEYAEHCDTHCQHWKPDIIHLDSVDVNRRWWVKSKSHARVALTLHGFCWGAFLTQWNLFRLGRAYAPKFDGEDFLKERRAFNTFHTVIGISIHEHWMLQDLMGLPQAKLVYNPIAPHFFSETKPLPDKPRFLCAAISGHSQRLFEVAEQAAKLAGVELVVVSDKKREEMPAVYDSCTALVLPTCYSQGLDLSVAEAMARGRSVIVSATGSYLRESEKWKWPMKAVPLGDVSTLATVMDCVAKFPTPPAAWVSDVHRPENHVSRWLEAIHD